MVLALFSPMNGTYTVTRSTGAVLKSGDSLKMGEVLTLTATPAPSCEFVMWELTACKKKITPVDNPYKYTVNMHDLEVNAIFFEDCVSCFLADAPVLTPAGYRAISSLSAGDVVTTADGGYAPIHEVKKQEIVPDKVSHPYVIPRGKFGATKNLPISPHHQVNVGDRYVEARFLGLKRKTMKEPYQYYNIELVDVKKDIIVAGVVVESWAPWDGVDRTAAGVPHR